MLDARSSLNAAKAPVRRRQRRAARPDADALPLVRSGAVKRQIPPYAPFAAEAIAAMEVQADWILKEVGIEFRDDAAALALFREAGASVDGARVRFETGQAREICATAPASFELKARLPVHNVQIGGDNVVLMPGYGSPFATDLDQGRRYASLTDFENFVKLAWSSPWLQHSGGTIVEPCDLPVNKRHLEMVYTHLRWSAKPFMGGVTAPERAADSIALAKIAFSDRADGGPIIQANINVNSPLVYDHTMTAALRIYAEAGQCVGISPAIFGGAMGPVTQPAVAAQTHAEVMAGIALTQLINPGCPVVYGSFHTTMNLRSGALTFGSPEAGLTSFALGQLARRLNVPFRAGGGQITAANSADGQAMQDSADAMWAALLSGSNQVWHAAGWLEGGLTMGYEKFVMDLDHCGSMLRMMGGLDFCDEGFGRDAYREVGPGENFLSTAHTLRHFKAANYEPGIAEAGAFEMWAEDGHQSAEVRANARWKKMLSDYEAPPMDEAVDEALRDFIERKTRDLPDEWH